MIREEGYYWVNAIGERHYSIAYWWNYDNEYSEDESGCWWVICSEDTLQDYDFDEIGKKVDHGDYSPIGY